MKLFVILFLILSSFATPKTISYRKLSWSDFKGKPDNRGAALSHTQINFEANYGDGKYSFVVYSSFLPDKSFTTTSKENILRHEQLHFDITELMVRKLRGLLVSVNDGKEANNLYDQTIKEWSEMQKRYDRETNNSINQGEQTKWEMEIDRQLGH